MTGRGAPRAGERGKKVAAILAGAWRLSPPPLAFSPEDLADVGPLLANTGAAALAWWRLRGSTLEGCPAAASLKQAYRYQTLQDAVHAQQIRDVFASLRSCGAKPVLAKGWAIARLYPEPGLRPYRDIDLYLRPDEHATALEALKTLDVPPPVDLHRGFSDLSDRSADELYARSRLLDMGGVEVRLLGPEDHLRLLCLHLLRHGAWRPLWLVDVAVALESRPPDFDWDYFLRGDRWSARAAASSLELAHHLLAARLDGTPAVERAQALPSWLVPTVVRQWGTMYATRDAIGGYLRRPLAALAELPRHWPNPIEGTAGVRAPFNELPRLPFQIAFSVARIARFAVSLPWLLWPKRAAP